MYYFPIFRCLKLNVVMALHQLLKEGAPAPIMEASAVGMHLFMRNPENMNKKWSFQNHPSPLSLSIQQFQIKRSPVDVNLFPLKPFIRSILRRFDLIIPVCYYYLEIFLIQPLKLICMFSKLLNKNKIVVFVFDYGVPVKNHY